MNLPRAVDSRISSSLPKAVALSLVCLAFGALAAWSPLAFAQTDPAAERGGVNVFAGVTASSFTVQYGDRKLAGVAAFVDVAGKSPLGLEAEARWLAFHPTDDVHVSTWLIGPRYRWKTSRYQVYFKGLAGLGNFNFPYNYAYGRYLVVAPGGGIDFELAGRLRVRLFDVEYQYWPDFTFRPMTSYGLSTGLRYRIY
jgi:hypothetical protein